MPRWQHFLVHELNTWIGLAFFSGALLVGRALFFADGWALGAGCLCWVLAVAWWVRNRWARRVGLALAVLAGLFSLAAWILEGGPPHYLAFIVLSFAVVGTLIRWEAGLLEEPTTLKNIQDPAPARPCLVMLLREPCYLDAMIVAHLAEKVWNTPFTLLDGPEDETWPQADEGESWRMNDQIFEESSAVVVGQAPHFTLLVHGRRYAVHSLSTPFFTQLDQLKLSVPKSLWSLVGQHRAFLVLERESQPESKQEVVQDYRDLARFSSTLLDDNCLALHAPAHHYTIPNRPGLESELWDAPNLTSMKASPDQPARDGEPMAGPDDQALLARQRWPRFVDAFEGRQHDDVFLVRCRAKDNAPSFWLKVGAIENDRIFGQECDDRDVRPDDPADSNIVRVASDKSSIGRRRYRSASLDDVVGWRFQSKGQWHRAGITGSTDAR